MGKEYISNLSEENSRGSRGCKLVTDGVPVEQVHIVLSGDINGVGRLFGGRIMEWIDIVSAVAARSYCRSDVSTIMLEELYFKQPAYLNDTIVMRGKVIAVGKTSMIVEVVSYVKKLAGQEFPINTARVKMVAMDSLGKPTPVNREEQ